MKWTWVLLIILLVWLVICVFVKLHLKKKLDDIDGLGSVASKRSDRNVIASFGTFDPDQDKDDYAFTAAYDELKTDTKQTPQAVIEEQLNEQNRETAKAQTRCSDKGKYTYTV